MNISLSGGWKSRSRINGLVQTLNTQSYGLSSCERARVGSACNQHHTTANQCRITALVVHCPMCVLTLVGVIRVVGRKVTSVAGRVLGGGEFEGALVMHWSLCVRHVPCGVE